MHLQCQRWTECSPSRHCKSVLKDFWYGLSLPNKTNGLHKCVIPSFIKSFFPALGLLVNQSPDVFDVILFQVTNHRSCRHRIRANVSAKLIEKVPLSKAEGYRPFPNVDSFQAVRVKLMMQHRCRSVH